MFRKPSNFANGNTRDRQGRLVTCEHGGRRVTRTEYDGTITVLADSFEGKRLNSPNDVVVKSDGSMWFTDPPSASSATTKATAPSRSCRSNVYRFDPRTGKLTVVDGGHRRPERARFSPDERRLYRGRSGAVAARDPRLRRGRRRHARSPTGACSSTRGPARRTACAATSDGNLWCGWGMGEPELDGVVDVQPEGKPIGRIRLPERCANLCFGGAQAQPAVHGGEPVGLLALREHAGRGLLVKPCRYPELPTFHNGGSPSQY